MFLGTSAVLHGSDPCYNCRVMKSKKTLTRWLGNIALAVAATFVGLLVLEGLVRLIVPQPLVQIRPDIWIPVEGIGHNMAPNVDTAINTGEGPIRLLSDSLGHRIGENPRPPGAHKILAVGDSFLEALQVDYDATVTARLEDLLPAQIDSARYTVVNAGVSGWNPNRYYIKVRDELDADDYELVIVFVFVGNDVVVDTTTYFAPRKSFAQPIHRPASFGYRDIVEAWVYPFYLKLRTHSHLVVFLKRRLLNLWLRLGFSNRPFEPIYVASYASSPRWDMTAHMLQMSADLAGVHGIPALFVLIPPDFAIDKDLGYAYAAGAGVDESLVDLGQPTRILSQKLRERGLTVFDPTARFQERFSDGVFLYGKVDRHLNAKGHDTLAQFILPGVVAALAAPPSRAP